MADVILKISVASHWKRIQDLLCEAIESGSIATFGIAGHVKPPKLTRRTDEKEVFKHLDYPVNEGGVVWLFNRYDEVEGEEDSPAAAWVEKRVIDGFTHYKLDIACIERGLQAFAEKSPHQFMLWWSENPAEDALTGDVFLQCAIFGEVVYG